jgi:uncharacterized protein YjiS (DUF1127 family)
MTTHFHAHHTRIASTLSRIAFRRRAPVAVEMNRHLFTDIGFSQSDIIALGTGFQR